MIVLVLATVAAAAVGTSSPAPLAFRHSWDTLPVIWFSANTSAPGCTADKTPMRDI